MDENFLYLESVVVRPRCGVCACRRNRGILLRRLLRQGFKLIDDVGKSGWIEIVNQGGNAIDLLDLSVGQSEGGERGIERLKLNLHICRIRWAGRGLRRCSVARRRLHCAGIRSCEQGARSGSPILIRVWRRLPEQNVRRNLSERHLAYLEY